MSISLLIIVICIGTLAGILFKKKVLLKKKGIQTGYFLPVLVGALGAFAGLYFGAVFGLTQNVHIFTIIFPVTGTTLFLVIYYFILRTLRSQTDSLQASNMETDENIERNTAYLQSGPISNYQDQDPLKHNARIFLSYRRSDSADITGRIYDRLVSRYGTEHIFKDVDSIPLGVDFRQHLNNVVANCDILIAIIGPEWIKKEKSDSEYTIDRANDFVRIELEAALNRDIPIIPALVRNATIPDKELLPSSLKNLVYRNSIAIRPDPDFHRDLDRLINSLDSHLKI